MGKFCLVLDEFYGICKWLSGLKRDLAGIGVDGSKVYVGERGMCLKINRAGNRCKIEKYPRAGLEKVTQVDIKLLK